MAQSKKQDEIIDLTEIVEKGRTPSTSPSANVDFDSALSDLLDKKSGSISLDETPELSDLLAGLDDDTSAASSETDFESEMEDENPDAASQTSARGASVSGASSGGTSPGGVPDDLDALINGLDLPENGMSAPPTPKPAAKPEIAADDVDSLLDSLLPGDGTPAVAPKPANQEISEADLDDLLNSFELESVGSSPAPDTATPVLDADVPGSDATLPDVGAALLAENDDLVLAQPDLSTPAQPKAKKPDAAPLLDLDFDLPEAPGNAASESPLDFSPEAVPESFLEATSAVEAPTAVSAKRAQAEPGASENFGDLGTLLDGMSDTPDNPVDAGEAESAPDEAETALDVELDADAGAFAETDMTELDSLFGDDKDSEVSILPETLSAPKSELADVNAVLFANATHQENTTPDDTSIVVEAELLEAPRSGTQADVSSAFGVAGATGVAVAHEVVSAMAESASDSSAPPQWMERLETEMTALRERVIVLESALQPESIQDRILELLVEGSPLSDRLTELMRAAVAKEVREAATKAELAESAANTLLERVEGLETHAGDVSPTDSLPDALEERLTALEGMRVGADEAVADTVTLLDRVALVEQAEQQVLETLGGVQSQLTTMEARLSDPSALSAFQDRLAALEERDSSSDTAAKFQERLSHVERQVPEALNALQAQLAGIESRLPDSGLVSTLQERLTVLENGGTAAVDERLAKLEERQQDLVWEKQQGMGELQERLAGLEQRGDALLEQRLIALEERMEPDVTVITGDVLKRVRSELDKVAAKSAARVLREEIAALVSGN